MSWKRILLPEKLIPQFISEVKKRECIWNSDDHRYSDRHATAVAWNEIVKIMDTPEDLLRAKWKNLRDLFNREIKKVRKRANSGEEDGYRGRWRYFKQMSFMRKRKPNNKELKKRLDYEKQEEEHSNDMNDDEEDEIVEEIDESDEGEDNPLSDCVKSEPEEPNEKEEHAQTYIELVEGPLQFRSSETEPVPNKRRKIEATTEDEEDYDMMFLKSLTPYMKQLDPMRKLIVRSRIQDVLINEITAQQQGIKNNIKRSS
ncbi:alcohol dehydrogenase transcription factor myb/SANT-like domain-containing protein [Phthorimaea operculella]|nr:alcohol dehydrogenase transcription factor myb/SANT-like domain-containing protein [Phthorimaea operculella]